MQTIPWSESINFPLDNFHSIPGLYEFAVINTKCIPTVQKSLISFGILRFIYCNYIDCNLLNVQEKLLSFAYSDEYFDVNCSFLKI